MPTETTKNSPSFNDDLLALHKEIAGMEFYKEAEGQIGTRNYKYQDLPSLMSALSPVLHKHNFVWFTKPGALLFDTNLEPTLKYILRHLTGEVIDGEMLLMSKAASPQDQGSAITYARRYSVSAMLGIAAEDDDGKKVQEAATAPVKGATTQAIYQLIQKLDMTVEEYEKSLGKTITSLSEAEALEVGAHLKAAVLRNATT